MCRSAFSTIVAIGLAAACFGGCAVVPHFGLFYSDEKHPVSYEPMDKDLFLAGKEYVLLARVSGEASVENYAGCIAMGDYSLEAAYKNALEKVKGADALIDVHVDQYTMRIFTLYIKATTIVTGTAIRTGSGLEGAKGAAPTPAKAPAETPAGEAKGPAAGSGEEKKPEGGGGGGEDEWK